MKSQFSYIFLLGKLTYNRVYELVGMIATEDDCLIFGYVFGTDHLDLFEEHIDQHPRHSRKKVSLLFIHMHACMCKATTYLRKIRMSPYTEKGGEILLTGS